MPSDIARRMIGETILRCLDLNARHNEVSAENLAKMGRDTLRTGRGGQRDLFVASFCAGGSVGAMCNVSRFFLGEGRDHANAFWQRENVTPGLMRDTVRGDEKTGLKILCRPPGLIPDVVNWAAAVASIVALAAGGGIGACLGAIVGLMGKVLGFKDAVAKSTTVGLLLGVWVVGLPVLIPGSLVANATCELCGATSLLLQYACVGIAGGLYAAGDFLLRGGKVVPRGDASAPLPV